MLSPYFLKQNLYIQSLTSAQVLEKLNTLFGCTYLENNQYPCIGILPVEYCVQFKEKFSAFSRLASFQYIEQDSIKNFEDFVILDQKATRKNQQGFQGGYIGFIDYNYAAKLQVNSNLKAQPNLYFGLYHSYIKFEQGDWNFYSTEKNGEKILEQVLDLLKRPTVKNFNITQSCKPNWHKKNYQKAFDQVQAYIRAGDCYQINLTQEFTAKSQGNLIDTAADFWHLTDAPYSSYLKVDDFEILSCSPELFIDFETNRKIMTKPIKGTMPRYEDAELDQVSKQTLINSEKDQAENVMIVDLLRNDLSLYAEIGSVQTPKLFNIESFNQVHHMVSEVTATLRPDVKPLDVLLSALPGGSITGAPKIRAMQIIEELEGAQRGAYCGSMGYFNHDGTGSWNILIRTVQKQAEDISIWAGGGITIASDCDAEYQECFDKVSAMLELLNTWKTVETKP